MQALLALEDGCIFNGRSFGDPEEVGAEVVFCTAMSGYQEILSDPSYCGQLVVFTAPHIGNYGIHRGLDESRRPWASGAILRDLSLFPSHPDAVEGLREYMRRQGLRGMTEVDTRALTLHLRERGVMRGFFTTHREDPEEAVAMARQVPPMSRRSLVAEVTSSAPQSRGVSADGPAPSVVILDYGLKEAIVRELRERGCQITVLPADAEPSLVDAQRPDGVVLSNGPGDPETLRPLLGTVRHCIDRYPTLAVCLGHQLAGLALGARIQKLRYGHHGANHPVKDLRTGLVRITAQNHNYAVAADRLPAAVELTHVNLNDGTVEGFLHQDLRLWSFQFHPEGAPGPHDAKSIFSDFVVSINRYASP